MQPREMQRFIDEVAIHHRDHLIDAIGELEAAVLDMHRRLAMRHILAGDIGDARHGSAFFGPRPSRPHTGGTPVLLAHHVPTLSGRSLPKTPRDLSFLCKAERSIPTKEAVREMLPPKRVTWARRYSRSNTSRASRSGRVMISPPLSHLTTEGAMAVISLGSMSARTGSSASPGAMIISQSMTLRNCLTFPGQV